MTCSRTPVSLEIAKSNTVPTWPHNVFMLIYYKCGTISIVMDNCATTCDFQQSGILTSVDSDELV